MNSPLNTTLLTMAAVAFCIAAAPLPANDTAIPVSTLAAEDFSTLRQHFVSPPKNGGTVTLHWLNGTITKEGIREQMRNLRDRDGFGGVAPLTFHAMKPATQPPYLTEGFFDVYGCIDSAGGVPVTCLRLALAPLQSRFYVATP